MKNCFILLLCWFFTGINDVNAQESGDPASNNLAHHYYPGVEIKFNYAISRQGDRMTAFLNFRTLESIDLDGIYTISYELKKDYMSKEALLSDSIPYSSLTSRNKNVFDFQVSFDVPRNAGLMWVHVTNRHNKMTYSFDVPLVNEFIFPRTSLIARKEGLPLFRKYLNVKDTITFSIPGAQSGDKRIFAYYYNTNFNAADPPMAEQGSRIKEDLKIERTIVLPLDSLVNFDQEGLYFIQADTNSNSGLSLLVKDIFFPRLAHIKDVADPLIYITTRAERERLMRSKDQKREMDFFWLSLTKSPENAKSLIKNYYQRVREANSQFTGYKEGWKTDKGMIYILYGPPDKVFRDEEKEEWVYEKIEGIPRISFSFIKIKNIFTDNHYVLMRSKDYERYWYRIVDMWRKGRFSDVQAKIE